MNRRNFFKKLAACMSSLALAPYIGPMGPILISPNPLYQNDEWREHILALWPDGSSPFLDMIKMMEIETTKMMIIPYHLWDD